jgi:hypothetical protein
MEQYTNEQLKAIAYDNLVAIERSQLEIKLINEELAKRAKEVPTEEKPKKK